MELRSVGILDLFEFGYLVLDRSSALHRGFILLPRQVAGAECTVDPLIRQIHVPAIVNRRIQRQYRQLALHLQPFKYQLLDKSFNRATVIYSVGDVRINR